MGKGVARERLSSKGFGEGVPIDSNATALGRAKNRRVEFTVLDPRPEGPPPSAPAASPPSPAPAAPKPAP